MSTPKVGKKKPFEFIALMALLMSLVALSIDAMLPALAAISDFFMLEDENSVHLVILIFFIGMSIGQLIFGSLSDAVGRKNAIYIGISMYALGCLIAVFAPSFMVLLFGRFMQGLGVSSGRVVSVAIIRDKYEGRAMARIMSFIMTIFMLVPALAPSLGQVILLFFRWQFIFIFLIVVAFLCLVWRFFRQEETLPIDKRVPFSFQQFFLALREITSSPVACGYTLASGLVFASVISYISTAQQIFQFLYDRGTQFPIYFGFLALSIGVASLINAKFVLIYGMQLLSSFALFIFVSISIIFFILVINVHPPLWLFMMYLLVAFFCTGMLFGNLNALAIEPLGHIAGTASAVIGAVQTCISVVLGGVVSQAYDGTIVPLVGGFAFFSIAALLVLFITEKLRKV